ncbi:MAG: T9SS type A sorting domain-containing protein [Paludibacteraceae bacterium]|nr:T9SS type A sorting domain-containing protein [Paludibacteraceae bacterium]
MKRFYKNTLIGRVSSYTIRVVALLCVLFGVSSSAWADKGFYDNNALILKFAHNDIEYKYNKSGHNQSTSLGTFEYGTAPSLLWFNYYTWKNGNSNFCSDGSAIYIQNNPGYSEVKLSDVTFMDVVSSSDGTTNERWKEYNLNNSVFPKTIGEHDFRLYVKAQCGENGSCDATYTLNNDPNGASGGYYHFTYTIKDSPIYVVGDGATGTGNTYEPCEYYSANIYRYQLKSKSWFQFCKNNDKNQNTDFYKKSTVDKNKCVGAEIDDTPENGGSINYKNIDEEGGYSEPVYFYFNVSNNTFWVEASRKTAYVLEFENETFGCYNVNEGADCGPHIIELGGGSHNFKVKKNGEVYHYEQQITVQGITKQELVQEDEYSTIELPEGSYYRCSFTTHDESGEMKLSVSCTKIEEPVLLTYNPVLSDNNKSVTLSAYLQKNLCFTSSITDYGFAICPGGNSGCIPDENSKRIHAAHRDPINRGSEFSYTTGLEEDNLLGGVTYGYRAYVKLEDGTTYLSRETNYFRLDDDCVPQPIIGPNAVSKVVYTVDASLGEDYENECKLIYGSLQNAINALKETSSNEDEAYRYVTKNKIDNNHHSYNLQVPVVFNVRYYDDTPDDDTQAYIYRGTKDVGSYAGENKPEYANLIKDINRKDANDANTLTIKAGDKVAKPWVHHIVIRNSKNIVLDSLAIFSDPADYDDGKEGTQTKGDNAIEIDVNSTDWPGLQIGGCSEANILIQNCIIGSDGFTGIHVSAYDGVTFKNNDFEAIFTSASGNDIDWGASAKFIACKNIKFVQNNFRGDHATLMWLQETQNVLLMNNVFWNTNNYVASGTSATPTAVRLVAQYAKNVQNVGCYYNTFYLAENEDKTTDYKYNFLQFSLTKATNGGSKDKFIDNTIEFMYNNCYSYASHCVRRDSDPFLDKEANFTLCPNNFWSEYDQAIYDDLTDDKKAIYTSAFEFGCADNEFINVKSQVCSTTASGPASLIVKGTGMNNGDKPDVSITNISLEDDEIYADRYIIGTRPDTDKDWTYGAYQSRDDIPTETIYWVGISEDWDDRNNWEYETKKDPNDTSENPEMVRQRVSCVNTFSENLRVVVEEIGSIEISGGRKWPKLPQFDGERSNSQYSEHVNAGLGKQGVTPRQFAESIELEYGAAIKGVENLEGEGNNTRYGSATMNFIAPRSQWVLVGSVVKPFENGVSGATRDIVSGDYYLNHLPKVKMHQIETTVGDDASAFAWEATFKELYIPVLPHDVFAIQIPDQYGTYGLPASKYNKKYGTSYDPTQPIEYPSFVGRFVEHDGNHPIEYTGLQANKWNLLNNSYPCNIDARKLDEISGGDVQYYDYNKGSFQPLTGVQGAVLLKPQHGFIYKHTSDNYLNVTSEMLVDGNTRSRVAEVEMPTFSLNLVNANNNVHSSNIAIHYDEFIGEGNASENDVEKVFATSVKESPELYIIAKDGKYASIDVATEDQTIPLGIRIKQAMNVRFEKSWFKGYSQAILIDKQTGKEYDLMTKTYTTEKLGVGDIEGRFFLNLEEPVIDDENPEDDNVSTDVEEMAANEINIIVEPDNTIKVITNGIELETIYISDMAGKTMKYDVSGYAVALNLPIAKGVYTISVVGDTASKTGKVILK